MYFKIVGGDESYFYIDTITGQISLLKQLDYEDISERNLAITVSIYDYIRRITISRLHVDYEVVRVEERIFVKLFDQLINTQIT